VTIEAGALALRITETGAEQVERRLRDIDNRARALGATPIRVPVAPIDTSLIDRQLAQMGRQVTLFKQGAQSAATRAGSLRELGSVEQQLRGIVAGTNTTLEQRIGAERQLNQLLGGRAAGTQSLTAALGQQLLVYLSFGAAIGAYNKVTDASDRAELAQRKLGAVARLTGTDLATITAIAGRARTEFAISAAGAADLTQQFVRLSSRAGDVAMTGGLMTAWMDLAAANGLTLDQALQSLQTTLAGQDEGLNRLGLMNPSQIWKKWADEAGRTVASMTEQEKWLAIVTNVTTEAAKVQGEYQKSLDTTIGKQQQFAAAMEGAAAIVGKSFGGMRENVYGLGTALAELIVWADKFFSKWDQGARDFDKKTAGFIDRGVNWLFAAAGVQRPGVAPAGATANKPLDLQALLGPAVANQTALHAPKPGRPPTAAEIAAAKAAAERAALLARAMAVPQLGLGDIGDSIGRTFTPVGVGKDGKMQTDTRAAKQLSEFEKKLDEAMERIRAKKQQMADLVMSIGQSIGSALGDGFTAAFSKSGDQNFFEAFGKSLLASLGNIVMQLGSSMLTYGLIASTFSSLLAFTPFAGITAGAGASIAAGIGLIALGAGMGAIAGGGKGGGAGGGGGSSKTAAPKPDEYAVAFDPDRKLRKNSGSAVGQTSRPLGNAPMPDARPVVNIGVLNTLTPDNAQWQRTVVESYNNGIMRGMKRAG
jgi:hypothetical protein